MVFGKRNFEFRFRSIIQFLLSSITIHVFTSISKVALQLFAMKIKNYAVNSRFGKQAEDKLWEAELDFSSFSLTLNATLYKFQDGSLLRINILWNNDT